MKQLLLSNYCIQEVDEGAKGFFVHFGALWTDITSPVNYYKKLPPGQWQIVEPTEEVAREIVEQVHIYDFRGYKNYEDRIFPLDTALESYHSLLRSEGIEQAILLQKI